MRSQWGSQIDHLVDRNYGKIAGLDYGLVFLIINAESNYMNVGPGRLGTQWTSIQVHHDSPTPSKTLYNPKFFDRGYVRCAF